MTKTIHSKVIQKMGVDRWDMFVRNGRWGTCCDCPTAANGATLPELCANTERDDHQLSSRELFSQYVDFTDAFDREEERKLNWQDFDGTLTMAALHNAGVANASIPQIIRMQQAMAAAYKPEEKW